MKKLNLKELKVKSFVTALKSDKKQTVKGGAKSLMGDSICNPCIPHTEGCDSQAFGICIMDR